MAAVYEVFRDWSDPGGRSERADEPTRSGGPGPRHLARSGLDIEGSGKGPDPSFPCESTETLGWSADLTNESGGGP